MLKIKKETIKKTKLDLEIDVELKKELELYLRVAKHFKYADKTTKLNDIMEEGLKLLVNSEDYKKLKAEFEPIEKAKKDAMAKAKAQQRAKANQKTTDKTKEKIG